MQSPGDFGNMDIGNVGDSGENTNMDSDDLVPSLQVSSILCFILCFPMNSRPIFIKFGLCMSIIISWQDKKF